MTTQPTPLRIVSYGGGVQSTALLVLAAQRRIDFRTFVMANVGDDSENPQTIDYVDKVARPFAAEHGIDLHLIDRVRRDGTVETLMQRLLEPKTCRPCKGTGVVPSDGASTGPAWASAVEHGLATDTLPCEPCEGTGRTESRSLPIPVRMDNGAPGNRSCTADFKIKVIGKWLKAHGASADNPATVGIGISLDEIMRTNSRKGQDFERVVYPLVGLGEETGLKLTRQDCTQVIRRAGLPVPPKSSCFFCPFHRPSAWTELRREQPELFDKAVELERTLNRRRERLGKDRVWLTRFAMPLDEAIGQPASLLPLEDVSDIDGQCDSGWCFT